MHQQIANSTFRIECGQSSGTGFSFRDNETIVTNHHVIEEHTTSKQPVFAITEEGKKFRTVLESFSHKSKYDFAILRLVDSLPSGRHILHPEEPTEIIKRGQKVLFAGFPHGIHDLLVHEAIISAPASNVGFYIDGAVNEGNSGGPIVNADNGKILGIVTQRRFLGAYSLRSLGKPVSELAVHCESIANKGSVSLMGVDFGQFANLMARGIKAISRVLEANSNTGIGIGFKIDFANKQFLASLNKRNDASSKLNVSRNSPCPCGSGKRYKECCGKIV